MQLSRRVEAHLHISILTLPEQRLSLFMQNPPYTQMLFSLLLHPHFMTVSALTLHCCFSECTYGKYVKRLKKQPVQLALAIREEIVFKTICFPAGCTFPNMVVSQKHQFQHNLRTYLIAALREVIEYLSISLEQLQFL